MTVNHEIKSQLAKLLATEDLVVEHRKVDTACFNVHTRVLTLPMWEKASGSVYDMLVGHEVGHALYTPNINWIEERKISPQVVNVVEDARIEKLMKRRYAGISKTFYRGYEELFDDDFFQIADENLDEMNLADRINLYFKIGNFEDIPFETDIEKELLKKVGECETFDDVLDVAEEIYKYCTEEKTPNIEHPETNPGESEETSEQGDPQVPSASDSADESEPQEEGEEEASADNKDDNVEVKTMDALEEALKDLINNEGLENIYVELPEVDLKKVIVSNAEAHNQCDLMWRDYQNSDCFDVIDNQYQKHKKSAQKEVNYLVKEFECKKAADSYARATTARTGVLDCSKLHTYKYNEDLFKKVTTLADGKNHGLIFILDWSASMSNVLVDTLKQLYNLIWFCKKVSIPFEVYAFTSEYPIANDKGIRERAYTPKDGVVCLPEWFSLMNIFSSKTNAKELDKQMKNVFRVAWGVRYYTTYPCPVGWSLSGTPLNETLVVLHKIIPQFKKDNGIQKVNTVILTDGEAAPLKFHREFMRRGPEPYIGVNSIGRNCFLRDRKTGIVRSLDGEWYQMTDKLLENLKDNIPGMNLIGIRVLEPRDAKSFIRRYCGYKGDKYEKVETIWKKERAFTIKDSAYDSYYGMSAAALSNDTEFDVDDGATKAKIKSAFVKSLRNKKMNKKILGEFVELVA